MDHVDHRAGVHVLAPRDDPSEEGDRLPFDDQGGGVQLRGLSRFRLLVGAGHQHSAGHVVGRLGLTDEARAGITLELSGRHLIGVHEAPDRTGAADGMDGVARGDELRDVELRGSADRGRKNWGRRRGHGITSG